MEKLKTIVNPNTLTPFMRKLHLTLCREASFLDF